ncbi:MAG: glycosyltransferase [Candidatus Odyssella sp.]|nr:glycosyltransferase [Candidatus Odyssella sp.]
MRVVMICRKYSGIGRDVWSPSGTPAVLKLIEEFEARGIAATVLFLAKSREAGRRDFATDYGRFRHVKFVHVGWRGWGGLPRIAGEAANSLRQLLRVAPYFFRRSDILYFDRGHLGFAAVASLVHRRVIWRCLGVMSFLLARDAGKRLGAVYLGAARLLLRFPIRLAVCTNDGSPWYRLFRSARARGRLLLLTNGVDRPAASPDRRSAGRPLTLGFVGRATRAKGIDVFVAACIALAQRGLPFRALVVGDGADRAAAEASARAAGLGETVRFLGSVPHGEVQSHLSAIDIYVSPAHNSGFSNTMLEALAAGCCVVALGPDAARGVDVSTWQFLPDSVAKWVDRADPATAIADAVAALIADPAECARRQAEALAFAQSSLPTWRERIDKEIGIYESLANGQAPPHGTLPWDRLAQVAFAVGRK